MIDGRVSWSLSHPGEEDPKHGWGLTVVMVVVALFLVVAGFSGLLPQVIDPQVTECGFDSTGAYAKVRINNFLGNGDARQQVWVEFSMGDGIPVGVSGALQEDPFAGGLAVVAVPALGSVTAVVHSEFPPLDDGVEGRTVYATGRRSGDPDDVRFVTEKFARKHPRGVRAETVPDDPGALRCSYGGDGF